MNVPKTTDTKCLRNEITVYQKSNYGGSSESWTSDWDGYGRGVGVGRGLDQISWWNDRISGFKKPVGASVVYTSIRGIKGGVQI